MATSRRLNLSEVGPTMELCFQETGHSPFIVYGTSFGIVAGWDLRMKELAFTLENAIKDGNNNKNNDNLKADGGHRRASL